MDQRLPVQQKTSGRSWWLKIIQSWSEIWSAPRFRARTQPVSVLYQRHRGQHRINSPSLCWWHHCLLGSILHPRCRNPTKRSEQAWNLGKKWHMEFHQEKCQVLTITRMRQPIVYNYTLHGHTLEHVETAKYLGITMTKDFLWNTHIENITTKPNQTLGFLRRNVQINCPRIKPAAYQTLVRPLLEYAPTVWDPHTQANIKKIEMVQRRATRYTLHQYHNTSSVIAMLDHLQWTPIEHGKQQQRVAMYYKIHHKQVAINRGQVPLPSKAHNQTLTKACAPSAQLNQGLPQECLLLLDNEGMVPAASPHRRSPIAGVFP